MYIGVGLGISNMEPSEKTYTDDSRLSTFGRKTEYKMGFSTSLSVGYKFSRFRAELERFSQSNDFADTHDISGTTRLQSVSGEVLATTLLMSGYYDFKVDSLKFAPFVGVGAGSGTFKYSYNSPTNSGFDVDDEDKVSAFAIIGGLDYAIKDNISIGGAFRHIKYSDIKINNKNGDELTVSTEMSSALIFTAKLKF